MSKVIIHNNFPQLTKKIEQTERRMLMAAAKTTVRVAKATPIPRGYRIQHIIAKIHADEPRRTSRGWSVAVICPDFRELFFEYGTLGRRRKKLKRARKLPTHTIDGKVRGIFPGYFLTRGVKAGKAAAEREMKFLRP